MNENHAVQISQETEARAITIDAFREAGRDLFELIVVMDKLMKAYDMTSLYFISDVFSTTSRYEQMGIIIAAMQTIRTQIGKEEQAL